MFRLEVIFFERPARRVPEYLAVLKPYTLNPKLRLCSGMWRAMVSLRPLPHPSPAAPFSLRRNPKPYTYALTFLRDDFGR